MRIAVIGTGYVGLVAGTCFAESGNDVICVDIDDKKVADLKEGKIPIYEPGLEEMVKHNVKEERLSFTTNTQNAVESSDVVFIAVGTPPDEDGSADLQYVLSVARDIGKYANGPKVIVDKSTVPVGTADKVKAAAQTETSHEMSVVSNPEFLKEGAAIDDFMKPDRVVIGSATESSRDVMHRLYEPFVHDNPNKIIHMDVKSAELTKYAANAMLATRISFMNEIANICERVGADVTNVRTGIGSDSRIGMPFLYAGCGYGGSCFPKDVQAVIRTAREFNYDFKILQSVEEVNAKQKFTVFEKVREHFEGDLAGRTFAIWGLAFKPRTDDMREAPAIYIINSLIEAGATVKATDPEAIEQASLRLGDKGDKLQYLEHPYETLENADALLLLTEWSEFRNPDFELIRKKLKSPVIFDGRNIFPKSEMEKMGFAYYPIGSAPTTHARRSASTT
ncbi:MAG: UDP-glucose/GDP-mannose dehydrogenase family protein [Planctomycetota bacterium]|jgi:UDPglucose 6-dehydrogenase|nr:UDP-glucose/GDP-mannose dehydrogenase family protein [Planctomycetota bacterium]